MIKEEVYNRENEEHENLLMRLWKSTFPNTPLENRVSEQWKLMGFQVWPFAVYLLTDNREQTQLLTFEGWVSWGL